jgi:ankyrin repeat protein
MPESYDGQNFVRAGVLSNALANHETAMEAIKVILFRLSNSLDRISSTPLLGLFASEAIGNLLPADGIVSPEDWTILAITDKFFQHALSEGDDGVKSVRRLLRLSLDVNRPTTVFNSYQMPLQGAIKMGAVKLVKFLIRCGADVNTTFDSQRPLLVQCAGHREHSLALELSQVLISTKRLVNKTTQLNRALLEAALQCNIDLVKFLLDQGAAINYSETPDLNSPYATITVLVNALHNGEDDGRFFRYHWKGYFAGFVPIGSRGTTINNGKRVKLAAYLLRRQNHGSKSLAPNPTAIVTPDALVSACLSGNTAAVELLSRHQADINACNSRLLTPLRAAVICGENEVFKLVCRLGANINAPPALGQMPLHHAAARHGCGWVLQRLVRQHGFELDCSVNQHGGNRPSLIHLAAWFGSKDIISWLVDHGADVNHKIDLRNEDDWLVSSAQYYYVDQDSKLRHARTALQVALCGESYHCVEFLLGQGAKWSDGDLVAVVKDYPERVVRNILLGNGNPYERDQNGLSVLELAQDRNCTHIIDRVDQLISEAAGTFRNESPVSSFLQGLIEWDWKSIYGESILEVAVNECIRQSNHKSLDLVLSQRPGAYESGALCAAISIFDSNQALALPIIERLLQNRKRTLPINMVEGTAIALAAMMESPQCIDLLLRYLPAQQQCRLPYRSKYHALADDIDGFWTEAIFNPFWHNPRNVISTSLFTAVREGNITTVFTLLSLVRAASQTC